MRGGSGGGRGAGVVGRGSSVLSRDSRSRGDGRRSLAARRGPAGWRRAPSPLDCTAFRFARRGGYPQWTCGSTRLIRRSRSPLKCTGLRVVSDIRAMHLNGCSCSPVESTAFRVASGGGYPHQGWRRVRSGACPHLWSSQPCESIWRRDIHIGVGETFDRGITLTVEIHSLSSGLGCRISTSDLATHSIEDSPSPFKSTAIRVASKVGYPHRRWRRVRSRAHPHRLNPQPFEWLRRSTGARPSSGILTPSPQVFVNFGQIEPANQHRCLLSAGCSPRICYPATINRWYARDVTGVALPNSIRFQQY